MNASDIRETVNRYIAELDRQAKCGIESPHDPIPNYLCLPPGYVDAYRELLEDVTKNMASHKCRVCGQNLWLDSKLNSTDQKRDKYLQKTYGVSLEWYNKKLEKQGGGCAVCGSKPITRSLPVDHDHAVARIKPKVWKRDGGWHTAFSIKQVDYLLTDFKSRKEARETATKVIKTASARGVICFHCNTGLRKFRDKPELLESAAKYIREYQEKICQNQ